MRWQIQTAPSPLQSNAPCRSDRNGSPNEIRCLPIKQICLSISLNQILLSEDLCYCYCVGPATCVAAMMRDHRAARCLNRSTLCGAEVWAVPASWARQVGRSVPRVCSLFRSSLVASAVLLDGGLLAMTANAPTMLSPSSSTCPSLAATHELISW